MSVPSQVQIEIVTTSQVMYYNNLPQPAPPKITMNGAPIPSPPNKPGSPTGYQVVIIDATKDYTNPANILANEYLCVFGSGGTNGWYNTYQYLYSRMVWTTLNSGNIDQQLLIIASFGLDANMPPTNDAYNLLLDIGAGKQLQYWQTHCDPGSQVGNPTSWVSFPANYIVVGFSALNYGEGYEIYQTGAGPLKTQLSVTLQNVQPPPGV